MMVPSNRKALIFITDIDYLCIIRIFITQYSLFLLFSIFNTCFNYKREYSILLIEERNTSNHVITPIHVQSPYPLTFHHLSLPVYLDPIYSPPSPPILYSTISIEDFIMYLHLPFHYSASFNFSTSNRRFSVTLFTLKHIPPILFPNILPPPFPLPFKQIRLCDPVRVRMAVIITSLSGMQWYNFALGQIINQKQFRIIFIPMLLIDSLGSRTIDSPLTQSHKFLDPTYSPTQTISQKHTIPELNISSVTPRNALITRVLSSPPHPNKHKITKIIKGRSYDYLVLLTYNNLTKELLMEVRPILNDLNSLQTSKYRCLHALLYFSTINPRHNLYTFRVNTHTQQIFISSALILLFSEINSAKTNKMINDVISLFEEEQDRINVYVSEKGLLDGNRRSLNEPLKKHLTLVSELLSESCESFNEISITSDSKENTYKQMDVKRNTFSPTPLKVTNKISSTFGVFESQLKGKVSKHDVLKQLIPVKQNNSDTMNNLCVRIAIKDSSQLKWYNLCSNRNNKIEIASVKLQIQNNTGQMTRLMVHKKPKTHNGENQFQNSKKIIDTFKNKNCVNILQSYFSNEKSFEQSVFTDYCKYGSLSNFIKTNKNTISLKTKIYFLSQVASSLQFLKHQEVVHMDIKPSNFLVAPDFWVKLTDFGQATFCGDRSPRGWTLPYVAPQRLQKSHGQYSADMSADIYSLGALMYQVITGKLLFSSRTSSFQKTDAYIEQRTPSTLFHPQSLLHHGPREIMIFLYDLITKCVNPIISMRPSIQEVLLILKSLHGAMRYLLIKST